MCVDLECAGCAFGHFPLCILEVAAHSTGVLLAPTSGGLPPLVDPSLEVGASVVGAPPRGGALSFASEYQRRLVLPQTAL